MNKETLKYLAGMEKRLATRKELTALEGRIVRRIDEKQEELARLTKRAFDERDEQLGEMHGLLVAIAKELDADIPALREGMNYSEVLTTHRKDIDELARRVKALESRPSKRK